MIKKFFLVMGLMAITASNSFAQLEVDDNGKVIIDEGNSSDYPYLRVGNTSQSDFTNQNYGIYSSLGSFTKDYNISIGGQSIRNSSNNAKYCIGQYGIAGNGQWSSFGTVGVLATGTASGAAIVGLINNSVPTMVPGRYAGFFDGQVHVQGSLFATSIHTSSDIRLKTNVCALTDLRSGESSLSNVLKMSAIKFNFDKTEAAKSPLRTVNDDNLHFGLSAQELQKIYPNLVQEEADGYLSVNYLELIPVLIQSIQELKQELDGVKGSKLTRSTDSEESAVSTSLTANKLYQNTPNPFKEQTTIRFQLADDAQNAAICIFDMSGKMLKKLPVSQGMTQITLNGYELGEGLYLYSLVVNGREIDTKRMILSK